MTVRDYVGATDLKIREVREAARCLRQGDPIEAVAMALKTNIRTLCEALTLANEVLKSDGAKLTLMELRTVVKMQVDLVKTSVIAKLYGIPPHQVHRQLRVYTMSEPTSP